MPRARSFATFSWVALFSHISVCIAGAKTIGHFAVNKMLVSKSFAAPEAVREIKSAVAGATRTKSAF